MNIIRNSLSLARWSTQCQLSARQVVRHGGTIPVILKDGLLNKGEGGDIVQVKRGFARNFLIPRKLAAYVTDANRKTLANLIESRKQVKETIAAAAAADIKLETKSEAKI